MSSQSKHEETKVGSWEQKHYIVSIQEWRADHPVDTNTSWISSAVQDTVGFCIDECHWPGGRAASCEPVSKRSSAAQGTWLRGQSAGPITARRSDLQGRLLKKFPWAREHVVQPAERTASTSLLTWP